MHAYAVKDRINYSTMSLVMETGKEQKLYSLLPSSEDCDTLKRRFSIHASRIMTGYFSFFQEDLKVLLKAISSISTVKKCQ